MKCPKCSNKIDLQKFRIGKSSCHHCGFYFYLAQFLYVACTATLEIDRNEKNLFKNFYSQFYFPFILELKDKIDPINGAEIMLNHLVDQVKFLIRGYPLDGLLLMHVALKELATWKIFSDNPWETVHLRNISSFFTNLLLTFESNLFGEREIEDKEDFIKIFIIVEEVHKLACNISNSKVFSWTPTMEDIILDRIETKELEEYYHYYEDKNRLNPEEITFDNVDLNNYLIERKMDSKTIHKEISQGIQSLLGFSFEEIDMLRVEMIEIAKKNGQIMEILPRMNIYFLFDFQLDKIRQSSTKIIIDLFTDTPISLKEPTLDDLLEAYRDYKFIFKYETIVFFGHLDSANSITTFKNSIMSDHFIEDIFGVKPTKPFIKAQDKIADLMAIKLALHFSQKDGFFVPMINNSVPQTNITVITGNGVRKRIVNTQNKDLGDIDAIAVDEIQKKIIILEIKYYKPSFVEKDLLKKDKKIFEHIEKILNRLNWIEENLCELIKAWDLKNTNYSVETIMVTARPNYYGRELQNYSEKLKYNTFDNILKE